jgi:hypothetical protein
VTALAGIVVRELGSCARSRGGGRRSHKRLAHARTLGLVSAGSDGKVKVSSIAALLKLLIYEALSS